MPRSLEKYLILYYTDFFFFIFLVNVIIVNASYNLTIVLLQGIKAESFPNCDFIPVEFPEVRHVKVSFKKLLRACVPSAPVADPDQMFLRAVENSEWLNQVITLTFFLISAILSFFC